MLLPSRPSMVSVVVCLVLGLVLLGAAGLKAAGGASARAALTTYGVGSPRVAVAAGAALIAVEVVLGVGVALGAELAARAAALFFSAATAAQVAAMLAGRTGAPCGCLGARGRLGTASAGRAAVL